MQSLLGRTETEKWRLERRNGQVTGSSPGCQAPRLQLQIYPGEEGFRAVEEELRGGGAGERRHIGNSDRCQ